MDNDTDNLRAVRCFGMRSASEISDREIRDEFGGLHYKDGDLEELLEEEAELDNLLRGRLDERQ